MQNVVAALLLGHPLRSRIAERRSRPHALYLRRKAEGKVGGMQRIHLKQGHHTCSCMATPGVEENFAHRKSNVRVGNNGALRRNVNLRGVVVHLNWNGVALHASLNAQMAEDFCRPYPGFKLAILLPENCTALSTHRKWIKPLHRLHDAEGTWLYVKGGDGLEGRLQGRYNLRRKWIAYPEKNQCQQSVPQA